jgi:hypothetical protein
LIDKSKSLSNIIILSEQQLNYEKTNLFVYYHRIFIYELNYKFYIYLWGKSSTFLKNSKISQINGFEPFYVATTLNCLNSKELKSHPYIIFEGICVQKINIKGVGKIVNKETFLNTVLENKMAYGQGNGTISTDEDGQSIS